MPLDRLVLILACIVAIIGAALWVGSIIWFSATIHPALATLVVAAAALCAYIVIRVITDRTNSAEDDHYDKMDH